MPAFGSRPVRSVRCAAACAGRNQKAVAELTPGATEWPRKGDSQRPAVTFCPASRRVLLKTARSPVWTSGNIKKTIHPGKIVSLECFSCIALRGGGRTAIFVSWIFLIFPFIIIITIIIIYVCACAHEPLRFKVKAEHCIIIKGMGA